jgi:hypothetical protein
MQQIFEMRFDAFPATEYDEVFSGYPPFDPADSPRKLHHTADICHYIS